MTDPIKPKPWHENEFMKHSWKPLAATVYILICLFDFIFVNMFIGLTRESFDVYSQHLVGLDPSVQIKLIDVYSRRWVPQTLQHGGIFHVAFGAILTGVAVKGYDGTGKK